MDDTLTGALAVFGTLVLVMLVIAGILLLVLTRVFKGRSLPTAAKLALGGALLYLVSPVDVVPDVAPLLGQLDDIALLGGAVAYAFSRAKPSGGVKQVDGKPDPGTTTAPSDEDEIVDAEVIEVDETATTDPKRPRRS